MPETQRPAIMSVNSDDANVPANNAPLLPTYSITDNSLVHCSFSLTRLLRVSPFPVPPILLSFSIFPEKRFSGSASLFLPPSYPFVSIVLSPAPSFPLGFHGGVLALVKGCTWDRKDKRNCANKSASPIIAAINRW